MEASYFYYYLFIAIFALTAILFGASTLLLAGLAAPPETFAHENIDL